MDTKININGIDFYPVPIKRKVYNRNVKGNKYVMLLQAMLMVNVAGINQKEYEGKTYIQCTANLLAAILDMKKHVIRAMLTKFDEFFPGVIVEKNHFYSHRGSRHKSLWYILDKELGIKYLEDAAQTIEPNYSFDENAQSYTDYISKILKDMNKTKEQLTI